MLTIFQLIFVLHITGCFWYNASIGNFLVSNKNWVTENELQDSDLLVKYATSMYWAIVTCTTVGYGDILPTNKYELVWAMVIIVFGVAIFSYYLSNLSSQFMEILRVQKNNFEKMKKLDNLNKKYNLDPKIMKRLTWYL